MRYTRDIKNRSEGLTSKAIALPGTTKTAILNIWRDDNVIHFTALTERHVRLFDLTASGDGSTLVLEGMREVARRELTAQGYSIIEEG